MPFFNKGKFPALGSLATKKPSASELAQQLKDKMDQDLSQLIGLKNTPALQDMIESIKYKYKVMAYEQALGDEFFGEKKAPESAEKPLDWYQTATPAEIQHISKLYKNYWDQQESTEPAPTIVSVGIQPGDIKVIGKISKFVKSVKVVELMASTTLPPTEVSVGLTVSKTKPPKKKKTKPAEKPKEIFQWQMHSQKEVAGVKATYTTVLRADGSVACNCPGWIFKKKGQSERRCKHTDLIVEEANTLFKKHKKGESLGKILVDTTPKSNAPSYAPVNAPTKYGRVIELD